MATLPPPKRVKRGHLLSDYRQKCVNGTRDSYCGVKSPFPPRMDNVPFFYRFFFRRASLSSLPEPCLWESNIKICPKSESNITQSRMGLCSERPEQGSSLFQGKLKFSPKPTPSHQVACSWEECKAAHLRACEAYANSGRSEA